MRQALSNLFTAISNNIIKSQQENPSCMGCMQVGVHRTVSTEPRKTF